MKRVDVVGLKKSLDPIAGMSAHIQKDTLLHPRDDFKTAAQLAKQFQDRDIAVRLAGKAPGKRDNCRRGNCRVRESRQRSGHQAGW